LHLKIFLPCCSWDLLVCGAAANWRVWRVLLRFWVW